MKRVISGPWHGLRMFALIAGLSVFSLAVVVLTIGWGLQVAALRTPLPDFAASMKPNAAIGVGALGLAVTLAQLGGPIRRLAALFTAVAAAIAAVTLAEYAFSWDAGIDQLFFLDPGIPPVSFPGRPALLTALILLLLSVGVTRSGRRGWRHMRTLCSMVALLVTWTLLNGYLFAYSTPAGVLPIGSVPVHAAAALFVAALGALASEPDSWPVRTALANNVGGTVCRWLLPPAILAPPLLGYLVRNPHAVGEAAAAFNWALYSVFSSAGSVGLILILAHRIQLLDAERTAATIMSRHDPLTSLANRRAFDAFLLDSFNRARRYQRPLSLLAIDVDEFKSYNDTFGHPAGDEVLTGLAAVFVSIARDTDLVARIGGEEFAIVLPETPAAGARALAERVQQKVSELRLHRPVTVSIGVATLMGGSTTAAGLLEQSDSALYMAKRGGRNQVVTWGKPTTLQVML